MSSLSPTLPFPLAGARLTGDTLRLLEQAAGQARDVRDLPALVRQAEAAEAYEPRAAVLVLLARRACLTDPELGAAVARCAWTWTALLGRADLPPALWARVLSLGVLGMTHTGSPWEALGPGLRLAQDLASALAPAVRRGDLAGHAAARTRLYGVAARARRPHRPHNYVRWLAFDLVMQDPTLGTRELEALAGTTDPQDEYERGRRVRLAAHAACTPQALEAIVGQTQDVGTWEGIAWTPGLCTHPLVRPRLVELQESSVEIQAALLGQQASGAMARWLLDMGQQPEQAPLVLRALAGLTPEQRAHTPHAVWRHLLAHATRAVRVEATRLLGSRTPP